ncbi:GAF domain-containing protein [bacterium]|nr:MAG: GAF domain-containing protein [bacterium]
MQTPPQQEKPETLSAKQQNTFKKFTGDSKGFQLPTNLPNKAPVVLFEWDMGDPERLEQNPKFDDDNVESPLRWVGSFEAHLGYEPGEFEHTFEAWVRVLHPEDRQRVLDAIERHLQDGEPFCEVCRARRSDGSWFQFAHSGVATRDAAGTPWKYTGTLSNFVEMETDPTEDQTLIPQHKHLEQLRAESLLRTASYLNAQLDLKQVCEAICEEAARTIGAPSAVMLFNKSRDAFVPAAVRDMPKDYDKRYTPTIRSIYEKHVSEMGPLFLFRDAQATPDLPNHKLYLEVDMRTIGIASLIREGEVLGLLKVYSFGESRTFDENELALLQGLADLGAQAISNARFFTESQRRLARIQSLRQIDMAILGSNDVHVSLNVVLDQVVSQLDCNAASILLFNSHSRTLDYSAGRGFHTGTGQRSPIRMGEGLAGRCALERRLIYVPDLNAPEAFADASDDSIWPFSTLDQPDCDLPDGGLFAFASSATMNQLQAGLLPREGFVSYYVVPLVAGGQVKGVLELWHRSSLRLEEEEVDFLETQNGVSSTAQETARSNTLII